MAFYEKVTDNTYRLVVCLGYDTTGKKLRKRKTIKIPDSLTPVQIKKELTRQKVLFEKEVLEGNFLDGENITFAEFTKRWLKDYAEINLSPATLVSYQQKLNERIIPAIGHIKLSKLQPIHLLGFYQNLHENNIRCDGKYRPKQKLIDILSSFSATQIEKETGITFKTCKRLKAGKETGAKTARKLCKKYGLKVKSVFDYCDKKTLSERTIRNHMGIIYSILSTAVKWNAIKDNPMQRIDMKKSTKRKVQYYDDEQVLKMLIALNNEPLMCKTMLYLAIDTGLRKGELTGLTWDDINFEYSQININKQRHYVFGYGVLNAKPKTEAGARIVTVSHTVINLLKQYRTQQLQQRLKLGTAWKNEPYVFLHDDGTAISPNFPYKWFISFLEKHNLPRITFHQLRHTNATLLIASGEDIVTVSSRLGHADKSITLNTYSHAIRRRDVEIAKKLDEFYDKLKFGN